LHNLSQDDHEAGDMKERPVNCEETVVAHDQASEVPQPRVGAIDDPAPFVLPKRAAIPRCRPNAISLVRTDQFDPALPQPLSQWIVVVRFVSDYPHRLLPWPTEVMTPPYPDRREHRFREPDDYDSVQPQILAELMWHEGA
jgi:hypothetical protein